MNVSFNTKQSHPNFSANVYAPDDCWDALSSCKSPYAKMKIANAKKRFRKFSPSGNVNLQLCSDMYKDYFLASEISKVNEDSRRPGHISFSYGDCKTFFEKESKCWRSTKAEWRNFFIKASKEYRNLVKLRSI